VPEGFREALTEADILGTRVLWFEREADQFCRPNSYPTLAVACASTHDLPTLAGWWRGSDVDERKALGSLTAEEAARQVAARKEDKRELIAALVEAGLVAVAPDVDGPLADSTAAAIHAFVATTPSLVALAQVDDLAGETIATNLPGTDRERPNWRRKLTGDVETLFSSSRARAIIAALAAQRPRETASEGAKSRMA
jgi:glycogen operon protein